MAGKTESGTEIKTGLWIGRGRGRTLVDPEEVKKLAALHCTIKEIAEWFKTTEKTISYHFADIITKAKLETKNSLRRTQLRVAMSGNVPMLIFLGKNMLGQSDNPQNNTENSEILPWED
jgi:hypothetical protein